MYIQSKANLRKEEIKNAKQVALTKLNSETNLQKNVGYGGGCLGIVIIVLFVITILLCDLLNLLSFLNLIRPRKMLIEIESYKRRRRNRASRLRKYKTSRANSVSSICTEEQFELRSPSNLEQESIRSQNEQLIYHSRIVRMKEAKYSKRHLNSSTFVRNEINVHPAEAFRTLLEDRKNSSKCFNFKPGRRVHDQDSSSSLTPIENGKQVSLSFTN